MYNYQLIKNIKNFDSHQLLIDIKKLLPKYLNSIPNNSAISILETVKKCNKKNYMLETGVGASTIAIFIGSYLMNKKFYSFDYNPDKISVIKQIINETICDKLKIRISDYWIAIPAESLCPYAGISSLRELKKKFDFCFLDSSHNLEHLRKELNLFLKLTAKQFYVGIDDAHMNYKKINIDFINLIRSKSNLKKISVKDNKCKEFQIEIFEELKKNFRYTKIIKPVNNLNSINDIYFKYYGNLSRKPDEKKKHKTAFYFVKKI